MTRLVPGQRLWPRAYNACVEGAPVTVASVGRTLAKVVYRNRTVSIPAEDGPRSPGQHSTGGHWPTIYYTDAGRAAQSAYMAPITAKNEARAALEKVTDLPTLNRVLSALGLPEVTAWTPPENE